MVVKRRTLSQNKKLAKETGMTLSEVIALDKEYVRRQKIIQKSYPSIPSF